MKTYKNLYPKVWAFDNLYLAYRQARKGKRGKSPAATFELKVKERRRGLFLAGGDPRRI